MGQGDAIAGLGSDPGAETSEIMRARLIGLPPLDLQTVGVHVGTLGKAKKFWYVSAISAF